MAGTGRAPFGSVPLPGTCESRGPRGPRLAAGGLGDPAPVAERPPRPNATESPWRRAPPTSTATVRGAAPRPNRHPRVCAPDSPVPTAPSSTHSPGAHMVRAGKGKG